MDLYSFSMVTLVACKYPFDAISYDNGNSSLLFVFRVFCVIPFAGDFLLLIVKGIQKSS